MMELIFPQYVQERMVQRGISVDDVREVMDNGEAIEEYRNEIPPRVLLLGFPSGRALHVVTEDDLLAKETTIVTCYLPDPRDWKEGFRERRS